MSQKLRSLIGKPELKEFLDYQIASLAKYGYTLTHSVDLGTHCSVQIRRDQWQFVRAIAHDGSREDAQAAGDEACLDAINAAWCHFRTKAIKTYR